MAEVTLDHVSKRFQEVAAVDDLSLTVADGEFLILVGPSGCGKTTALRLIAGLEKGSAGTIRIGERVVNDVTPRDRDIAMVFQNYALYPHMTVYKNLAFGLKERKTPKPEIERRVREVGEMLGLKDLMKRRPAQLSGGQRQRVAMGRALVREPAAFVTRRVYSGSRTFSASVRERSPEVSASVSRWAARTSVSRRRS